MSRLIFEYVPDISDRQENGAVGMLRAAQPDNSDDVVVVVVQPGGHEGGTSIAVKPLVAREFARAILEAVGTVAPSSPKPSGTAGDPKAGRSTATS